jgi:hypothetical protein
MLARNLRVGQKYQIAGSSVTYEVASAPRRSGGKIHFRVKGQSESVWMTHGAVVTLVP